MADSGRIDVKRTRGLSVSSSTSAGSHGRRRFPEKLVDRGRRIADLGVSKVDNGASMTPGLANLVSKKACQLEMKLKNTVTGGFAVSWGQAGLIRGDRLTASPETDNPRKRRAVAGTDSERPAVEVPTSSSLRSSSRFEAMPITCIHNLEDDEEQGIAFEFVWSELKPIFANEMEVVSFDKARYTPSPEESIVLRPGDPDGGDDEITWEYHDVATAPKISNPASPLTGKNLSFEKVTRDGYEFQVGQKIGMAVFRSFEVTASDAGMAVNSIASEQLQEIFGEKDCVNIYTGQIMDVSPSGEAFMHNINTFQGCSGAVIFLLDLGQDGFGVDESDSGKAIAIHAGGDQLSDGSIVNFGFKII